MVIVNDKIGTIHILYNITPRPSPPIQNTVKCCKHQ